MQRPYDSRQKWMRLLAISNWDDLKESAKYFELIPYEMIRPPETGMIMLRGRMGGTGAAFNLGEATVTRCAVKTHKGFEGHSYVMGRNHEHAKLAAICDALLQDEESHASVTRSLLHPLEKILTEKKELVKRKSEATKVDFFTLVRGENE